VAGDVAGRLMVRRGANRVGEPVAPLVRTETARAVGGFDESEPYCIDLAMWLRLLERGDLFVLDRAVAKYRIVETSWSAAVATSQDADVAALLHETVERGAFGATAQDAEAGVRSAKRQARGRRLVYRGLFDRELHRQVRYLFVGGWNTLFGFLVFTVLYFFLHAYLADTAILVISYVPSILNAYLGYKKVVFKTDSSPLREFPRFAIVYVVALAANVLVLPVLKSALGGSAYLGQAAFTVALVVTTYVFNKQFSFRQEQPK
jgi:putative flippase GtrA